jgi:hypothetical protein
LRAGPLRVDRLRAGPLRVDRLRAGPLRVDRLRARPLRVDRPYASIMRLAVRKVPFAATYLMIDGQNLGGMGQPLPALGSRPVA